MQRRTRDQQGNTNKQARSQAIQTNFVCVRDCLTCLLVTWLVGRSFCCLLCSVRLRAPPYAACKASFWPSELTTARANAFLLSHLSLSDRLLLLLPASHSSQPSPRAKQTDERATGAAMMMHGWLMQPRRTTARGAASGTHQPVESSRGIMWCQEIN
jgi:hypothetical protein